MPKPVRSEYIRKKCNELPQGTDDRKKCLNKAVGVAFPKLGIDKRSMASIPELKNELRGFKRNKLRKRQL